MIFIFILFSVILSAFFSGMEIAFVSANKIQLEIEKNKNTFYSKLLNHLTKNPSKFITSMLVGNNIALVVYGYFMGDLIMNFITPHMSNEFLMLIVQTIVSTIIILVTAEFLPKAIFRIYANEAIKYFSFIAFFFYILFYMISWFVSEISDLLLRVFFNTSQDEEQTEFSKKELNNFISEQLETSDSKEYIDSEIQIFQNALEFHNVKAREVMIPRTELIAVEVHETVKKLRETFIETGLSKILVFSTNFDDIIGYVNAFELFKKPKNIRSILLPIEFVPETMLIKNVLDTLSKKRKSIAIVLDEYGGTSGLITKEDIIEELFGEIEDEHDKTESIENQLNENEYVFSARLEIDYLNETYDFKIPKEDSYETLGGYIVHHTESIPDLNEKIIIDNHTYIITKVSNSKIEEIHLIKEIELI